MFFSKRITNYGFFISLFFLLIELSPILASERDLLRSDADTASSHSVEKKMAIVVGVDEYDYVSNLNYAEADANALASFFESQGYIVRKVLGYKASRKRILSYIEEFDKILDSESEQPEGTIVFTFSGHGFNNNESNFLAIPDTSPDGLEQTALPMAEIVNAMQKLNVRKRLLFIDACRNNPEEPTKNVAGRNGTFLHDDSESEGLAIMYSTAKGKLSWEDKALGRGVFTHFLLKGLQGAAGNQSGVVNFDDLHKYVAEAVNYHVFKTFSGEQKPYRGGEWSGEFILARHDVQDRPRLPQPETRAETTDPLPRENKISEQSVFSFIAAASNIAAVRSLFCEVHDPNMGQTLKKNANKIFEGTYEYRNKKDEEKGWSMFLESIRHCSTSALMEIANKLKKRKRCDLAIPYAKLAVEHGNKSAARLVSSLERSMNRCVG